MTNHGDPVARVREVVDEYTDGGPYTPRLAATEIVAKLRQNEPQVLAAWLDLQAETFIWQMINDRDRSRRSHGAHVGRSAAFRDARSAHESGDGKALRAFLDAPFTVADGTRRKLAELRRDDLTFVAERYDERARKNGMWSAFIGALARKVGRDTVADRFTEEQLDEMWSSISAL